MMKNVLVTGGRGFIGSHLVDELVTLGYSVTVIDDLSSPGCHLTTENSSATYLYEDIRALNQHVSFRQNESPDVIFHLAARARIGHSFQYPREYFDINSKGTTEVLEYARRIQARVIYAGSSSSSGSKYANPYTFSKQVGEDLCKLYSYHYGVETAIARFFNVYGPRSPQEGYYATLIGIFDLLKKEGKPLTITGDGEQRRDFTHVNDIVSGLIAIGFASPEVSSDYLGELFEIGRGKNYSINEIAEMYGGEREYIPSRPGEIRETLANTAKLEKRFGWKPKYELKDWIYGHSN